MNFRKLLSLLDYIALGLYICFILLVPERFFQNAIIILITIFVIEVSYYSYEYIKYLRPGKIYVFESRNYILQFDSIISKLIGVLLILAFSFNRSDLDFNNNSAFIFFLLISIRGFVFLNLKESPRLDKEKLRFNELFIPDIFLKEIKSATLDDKDYDIKIVLHDGSTRVLHLKEKFYKKERPNFVSAFGLEDNVA